MYKQKLSDGALESFSYFSPDITTIDFPNEKKNSSLKVAGIAEGDFENSFHHECEFFTVNKNNWRFTLKYGDIDFLLIQSLWKSNDSWSMAQSINNEDGKELRLLIKSFREAGIPTVYWITMDHSYHQHFKDLANEFDYVFCSDKKELELLRENGFLNTKFLPPFVHPKIYNPFKFFEHYDSLELGSIFDGWADLDRSSSYHELLKSIKEIGRLDIIESRYKVTKARRNTLGGALSSSVIGCVHGLDIPNVLKYGKNYLSFEETLSNSTTAQWNALRAAASYLPVLHLGEIAEHDLRKDFVLEVSTTREFLVELQRRSEDDLYRKRCAHLAWRKVYQKHSFSNRFDSICKYIGMNNEWEEFPKISVITPTCRKEYLKKSFENYDKQNYPNKELILVYNGDDKALRQDLGVSEKRSDIKLFNLPHGHFTGSAMNFGNLCSSGKYLFKFDDDDEYGVNYITDFVLALRSIDAVRFGKPPSPFRFNPSNDIFCRKNPRSLPFTVAKGSLFADAELWPGGNSIGEQREMSSQMQYPWHAVDGNDSSAIRNTLPDLPVILTDEFNIIANRREDTSNHTWQINENDLKKKLKDSEYIIDDWFL